MSSDTKFGSNILANSLKSLFPRQGKKITSSFKFISRDLIASVDDGDDGDNAPNKTVSGAS
jgi:hypothetical protein